MNKPIFLHSVKARYSYGSDGSCHVVITSFRFERDYIRIPCDYSKNLKEQVVETLEEIGFVIKSYSEARNYYIFCLYQFEPLFYTYKKYLSTKQEREEK